MKKSIKLLERSNKSFLKKVIELFSLAFLVLFLSSSCSQVLKIGLQSAFKGEETGGGACVTLGSKKVAENLGLNGVVAYNYLKFQNGHDNLLKAAAQIRHNKENSPLWFGGELGAVRDISVYDQSYWNENPAGNGITVGALAGYKLPVNSLNMNVYTGLSLISFGDFKADDHVVESGHTTMLFRIGVEFEFSFTK